MRMPDARALLLPLFAVLAACAAPPPPLDETKVAAGTALSASVADRFQEELLGTLQQTIARDGMVAAIAVCAEEAPAIAARLSAESGARVRRTALRPRNPAAAPDGLEAAVMQQWAEAPLDPQGRPRVHAATVRTGGTEELRFLRAIPTAPQCLACHGDPGLMADELKAAIAARYPDDRATGFAAGQMRGAFSIRWDAAALRAALSRQSGA